MIEQLFFYFPYKPVQIGDFWETNATLNGQIQADRISKITFKNVKSKMVAFDFEGIISTSGGPFTQDIYDMKVKTEIDGMQNGSVQINQETGLPMKIEIFHNIQGKTAADDTVTT